jgi:hypothetical protein
MLGVDSTSPSSGSSQLADWRGRSAAFLLGTVVVGITVNILSERPVPALGLTVGSAAVLRMAWWLRRYPARSILRRAARIVLWCGAAGFGLVAAQSWAVSAAESEGMLRAVKVVETEQLRMIAPYAAAVGLLAVTVLTAADLFDAARRLGTAVVLALGAAYLCAAEAALRPDGHAGNFAYCVLVAAGIFIGCWAWLRGDGRMRGKALVGVGATLVLLGRIDGDEFDPVVTQCCGGAIVTAGIAMLCGRDRLWRGAVGVLGVVLGIVWCRSDDPLLGASAVVFGAGLVTLGAAGREDDLLAGVGYLGFGTPFVMFGVGMIRFIDAPYLHEVPVMIETVLAGVAFILHGVARLRGAETRRRLGRWWESATADRPGR